MVTGSYASSFYGEPRTTHDLDLVVHMDENQVELLHRQFPHPDFYMDDVAAKEAILSSGMFNLISTLAGDKVDFWILTSTEWDRSRFERRRSENVLGVNLKMPTPEDVILAKLHWCKLSGESEKQFLDATAVYEIQGATLDISYIERWADQLEITDLWNRVVDAGEIV